MNTYGHGNTASGHSALYSNTYGYQNTASGFNTLYNNTTGNYNTASGHHALYANTIGYNNTASGYYALSLNNTGYNNTAIGSYADVSTGDLFNATAIGNYAKVNASNKVVIGNSSVTSIGGYAIWTNFSDLRLKENIVYENSLGLDFIRKLRTVTYNFKADENKRRRNGLIAQDVEQALGDLGLNFSGLVIDDDKDKTMNLSYGEFVIPLINAVQELSRQNEDQRHQIEEQNGQLSALKERLSRLEALLGK